MSGIAFESFSLDLSKLWWAVLVSSTISDIFIYPSAYWQLGAFLGFFILPFFFAVLNSSTKAAFGGIITSSILALLISSGL